MALPLQKQLDATCLRNFATRSFAALVGVERETVRAPRRSIMVLALEKRRQSKYDGLVDRFMTELFITGATLMRSWGVPSCRTCLRGRHFCSACWKIGVCWQSRAVQGRCARAMGKSRTQSLLPPSRHATRLDHSIRCSEQGCQACPGRSNLCSIWEASADRVWGPLLALHHANEHRRICSPVTCSSSCEHNDSVTR